MSDSKIKDNCMWESINTKYVRENSTNVLRKSSMDDFKERICSACQQYRKITIVSNMNKYICLDCLK